ncbi:radical SAM protein [Methanosarcina sp. KYL-1]|nr:radical SAM protein [Methanosarcina sp. KYL-1]
MACKEIKVNFKANCIEIEAKSALHRLSPLEKRLPYSWDLNVYRGCGHGCRYCYAVYSHGYICQREGQRRAEKRDFPGPQKQISDFFPQSSPEISPQVSSSQKCGPVPVSGSFFRDIYVKKNIAGLLERELSSPAWKKELINLGGVTDSYQSAERKCRLMPEVLEVLLRHKNPVTISTKSDLVLRDFDLIAELAERTRVNVAVTVTTLDEQVRKKLEPGAPDSERRFSVLEAFSETKATVGLHMMPVLPGITDSPENLEGILARAGEIGVDYALSGLLFLKGETRTEFMSIIGEEFPGLLASYKKMYMGGRDDEQYRASLYSEICRLKAKHGLAEHRLAEHRLVEHRQAEYRLAGDADF